MTFHEIDKEWSHASANVEGSQLNPRAFQRYRILTEELFNVNIECNKPTNEYWVDTDTMEEIDQWTVSALRMQNLVSMVDRNTHIMLEPPPAGSKFVKPLAEACSKANEVEINYKSPYQLSCRYTFIPYFLRLFKQRWYVTGRQPDKDYLTTFALERISDLRIGEPVISKDPQVTAEEYFHDCFGIIRQGKPERIIVRAFWPQNTYIKEVPLHHSQMVVDETDNWTDFSLFVRPSYDFKQELLWHRDKLTVLSPQWLRDDMTDILQRMLKSYQTGLPNCKNE